MKRAVLLLFLFSISLLASAQDTLFRGGGKYTLIHVQSHNMFTVRYLTVKDGDTQRHVINRRNVLQLGFADGTYLKSLSAKDWDHIRGIHSKRVPLIRGGNYNTLTLLVPAFYTVGGYPGISIGLDYSRFLSQAGKLSVSLSVQQVKSGTQVLNKKLGEYSTEIHASIFTPGIFYHPIGNRRIIDLSLGCVFPVGSMRRQDVTPDLNNRNAPWFRYTLTGLLFQVNASAQLSKHFIAGAYVAYGPMLTAGITNGVLGAAGLKIGWWF
jgi:hypothetical protein